MSDPFITVATFSTAQTADFYKMILDSEGIENFLQGDHLNTAAPHYSLVTSGVELMVKKEDAKRALAILHDHPETDSSFLIQEKPKFENEAQQLKHLIAENWILLVIILGALVVVFYWLFDSVSNQGGLF